MEVHLVILLTSCLSNVRLVCGGGEGGGMTTMHTLQFNSPLKLNCCFPLALISGVLQLKRVLPRHVAPEDPAEQVYSNFSGMAARARTIATNNHKRKRIHIHVHIHTRKHTVEPCFTTTSLIRPPCSYDHDFWSGKTHIPYIFLLKPR